MFKIFILLLTVITSINAQVYEAEDATLVDLTKVTTPSGYSGSGAVEMGGSGSVTFYVTVATTAIYKLTLRVVTDQGAKQQSLFIDNVQTSLLSFPAQNTYFDFNAGSMKLTAGTHKIKVEKGWGFMTFDKLTLSQAEPTDYSAAASDLINSDANAETKNLYSRLRNGYGKQILSGQVSYWNDLINIAQKTPVVRAFDFQTYTQGYSYNWDSNVGGHAFGWSDNGNTKTAIDWYKSTAGKGIVTFQWHWHSPSGGIVGTNTFSTTNTTFDVSKITDKNSNEYKLMVEDIDSIATQLKKLQSAGVPVLWRPLHEADGTWFWWGAKGAESCLALYDVLYDRLTNYHHLNNLIWVWSSAEKDWYPGNDKVDIIGYDSYPGDYVYGSQKSMFDTLYELVEGQKMVTMSENGPIPDPTICYEDGAMWLYFSSWDNLVEKQNSLSHIKSVYADSKVITLDEVDLATSTVSQHLREGISIYPNPAIEKITITLLSGKTYNVEIRNGSGVTMYENKDSEVEIMIPVSHWKQGVYNILLNGVLVEKVYVTK